MFGQLFAIARNTFVESIRQPVYFVLLMVGLLAQVFNLLLSGFSMGFTEEREVSGDDKLLLDMGLATVMVCATLLAAFIATNVLTREIENRTALTVISKPVGRPLFVIGKFFGVSGAMTMAVIILLTFMLFALRHKVMSTARDAVDPVVVLMLCLAVLGPIALGTWGNYFYGWVFSSTTTIAMLPASILGYIGSLAFSKEWAVQPLATDFKPQIMVAAGCALLAMLVLTSAAIALSTRLGQVMTIVGCGAIFMLGLLSNYLFGRYAFSNNQIAVISEVEWPNNEPNTLTEAGQSVVVVLDSSPRETLRPGSSFYYGSDPSGLEQAVPPHGAFNGDVTHPADLRNPEMGQALVVREITLEDHRVTLANAGGLAVKRPPVTGDYAFAKPTRRNAAARVAWSVIPNIQAYWLVDAITQGHKIPVKYVGLLAAYSGAQIACFLSLAVYLFQRRDIG